MFLFVSILKGEVGFIKDRFGMLERLSFKTLKNNRKKKTAKSKVYEDFDKQLPAVTCFRFALQQCVLDSFI